MKVHRHAGIEGAGRELLASLEAEVSEELFNQFVESSAAIGWTKTNMQEVKDLLKCLHDFLENISPNTR